MSRRAQRLIDECQRFLGPAESVRWAFPAIAGIHPLLLVLRPRLRRLLFPNRRVRLYYLAVTDSAIILMRGGRERPIWALRTFPTELVGRFPRARFNARGWPHARTRVLGEPLWVHWMDASQARAADAELDRTGR